MDKLRVLDLFSGIGGFSLGLERTGGFETVAFCEYDDFPRRVLAKHWPDTPCFPDVRTLKGSDIDGPVDVICGGYPCQPFSTAGKRQGQADDRHLWPEFMRLVAELRPAWVIGENVAGHISMGLDDVLADLEAEGYACRPFVIPACAIGASHRRDRVWTVAYSKNHGQQVRGAGNKGRNDRAPGGIGVWPELGRGDTGGGKGALADPAIPRLSDGQRARQPQNAAQGGTGVVAQSERCSADVADTIGGGRQGQGQPFNSSDQTAHGKRQTVEPVNGGQRSERGAESRMGRMADGFSCWLDEPEERVKAGVKDRAPRLKALGNAVHPDIPMMIGAAILEAEAQSR